MSKYKFLVPIFIALFSVTSIFACGSDESEENDNDEEQNLVEEVEFDEDLDTVFAEGDTYTFSATASPESADNKDLVYQSWNTDIVDIDSDTGEAEFKRAGKTQIKAVADDESDVEDVLTVEVVAETQKFSTPSNLKVESNSDDWQDTDSYKLTWDEISIDLDSGDSDEDSESKEPQHYLLEINQEEYQSVDNEFDIEDFGVENKVKIKAVGLGPGLESSEFSEDFSFTILEKPENISNTEDSLSWDAVDDAQEYNIDINGTEHTTEENKLEDIDFSTAKEYKIKIQAYNSEDDAIYDSIVNDDYEVIRLERPSNIKVEDDRLGWDNVDHASAYTIEIYDSDEEKIDEITRQQNRYSIPDDISSGDYEFRIKAIGDSIEYVLDSEYSNKSSFNRLETPTNVEIENNKVKWDEINDASSYTLIINNDEIQQYQDNEYELDSEYEAGDYEFYVKAQGSNSSALASKRSEKLSFKKLDVPSLSIDDGKLHWSSVNNAQNYELEINEEKQTFDSDTLEYKLDEEYESGEYNISIKATSSDNIDSNFSESLEVEKMQSPKNLRIESGVVRWDFSPRVSEYIVSVGDQEISTGVFNQYKMEGQTPGEYNISVRAKTTGGTELLNSNYTNSLNVKKLDTPENIKLENGFLTFDTVTDATGYNLDIDGEKIYKEDISEPIHLDLDYSEDLYDLGIQAVGDSEEFVNSDVSEKDEVKQLKPIDNFEVDNHKLNWSVDSDDTMPLNYKVVIEPYHVLEEQEVIEDHVIEETVEDEFSYELDSLESKLNDYEEFKGEYKARIIGLGDNTNLLSTSWTEEVHFTKLSAPEEFNVDSSGQVSWDFQGDYGK